MSEQDYRPQAVRIMTSPYGLETVESLLLAHDLHLTVMPRLRDVAEAAEALVKRMDECAGFIDGDEEADRLLSALRHAVREGQAT